MIDSPKYSPSSPSYSPESPRYSQSNEEIDEDFKSRKEDNSLWSKMCPDICGEIAMFLDRIDVLSFRSTCVDIRCIVNLRINWRKWFDDSGFCPRKVGELMHLIPDPKTNPMEAYFKLKKLKYEVSLKVYLYLECLCIFELKGLFNRVRTDMSSNHLTHKHVAKMIGFDDYVISIGGKLQDLYYIDTVSEAVKLYRVSKSANATNAAPGLLIPVHYYDFNSSPNVFFPCNTTVFFPCNRRELEISDNDFILDGIYEDGHKWDMFKGDFCY